MIADGAMAGLMARKREVAAQRWDLAVGMLGLTAPDLPGFGPAFHLWVPLRRPVAEIIAEAAMQGVVLAPAAQLSGGEAPAGLRLCLGAPGSLEELQWALARLAGVLEGLESRSLL